MKEKVDPSDIPLPDLSGKKEDEMSSEKLAKLREKKPRTDVGEQIAEKVKSLPENIPLPSSENVTKTVSSDALPTGPPTEPSKESDSTFIGPRLPNMAPPPPPPPGGNMGHMRFPHGPRGPPHPGYWDQWDPYWDRPGPWDGPGPGPRPYRGMRPPFDPRMRGPYDPRLRGPPPFMNRPRGPHPYGMGPRYGPGMHGPPPGDYGEYEDHGYNEEGSANGPVPASEPPKKDASPPPLPPPKAPSPKPPPPKKKEIKEPEQNPAIAYPPEQIEKYKHLQEKAAKHARKQQRREQKKALGEPDEDSSSSEEEQEEQLMQQLQEESAEAALMEEMATPQLVAVPGQQVIIGPPQPASSPRYSVMVSGSQQFLIPNQSLVSLHSGMPLQAGAPVLAVSQNSILANHMAAASNAQPAHLFPVQSGHHGIMVAQPAASIMQHQLQQAAQIQHLQQLQQIHHAQQMQQAQAIQAHNLAVAQAQARAAAHGPIIVGNQVLVPTLGMRPAI